MAQRQKDVSKAKPAPGFFWALGQLVLFFFKSVGGLLNLLRTRPIETLGVGFIGFAAFVIVPNALFFQKGDHPSPLLRHSQLARYQGNDALFTGSVPNQPLPARIEARPAEIYDYDVGMVLPNPRPRPQHVADAFLERMKPQPVIKRVEPRIRGNKTVFALQLMLADMGFYQQKVDGQYGPNTRQSIRNFEAMYGLPVTGQPTRRLLDQVRQVKTQLDAGSQPRVINARRSDPPNGRNQALDLVQRILDNADLPQRPQVNVGRAQAQQVIEPATSPEHIARIQRGLASLGYYRGNRITGVMDETTQSAIRNFEVVHNFRATGEPSQWLLEQLVRAGAVV